MISPKISRRIWKKKSPTSWNADYRRRKPGCRRIESFGNATLIAETGREVWGRAWLEEFGQDIRYAARGLQRDLLLTLAATLTLTVCIAVNTTVFSIVKSVLLRPLPYPDSNRIYWLSERAGRDQMEIGLGPDYYSLRQENKVLEDVAAYDGDTVNWTGVETSEQLTAAQVTPSFFGVMGTQPMIGRYLAPEGRQLARNTVAQSYC
jgi:hypothetical protein